jgi:hypothetical protein
MPSRTMRELLLTTADLLLYDLLQDADARLFVHKHRIALREMRPANRTTLAAIKEAKSSNLSEVSPDEL